MSDPFNTGAEIHLFGEIPDWRDGLEDDDPDDELIDTPGDVVAVLGFNPAGEGESGRLENVSAAQLNAALSKLSGLGVAVVEPEKHVQPIKYADGDTNRKWIQYTGPKGGAGWKNTETGLIVYQDERPGEDETGEELGGEPGKGGPQAAAEPQQPTMQNPIPTPYPLGPGAASGAPGVPGFIDNPPSPVIPLHDTPPGQGDVEQREGAPPIEEPTGGLPPGPGGMKPGQVERPTADGNWGTVDSVAGFYGRADMDRQTAARFNVATARKMGLDIPKGNPEQQAQLATEYLKHNAERLTTTMNAAESMGWKPRAKHTLTNAVSAGRYLMREAESSGYEPHGGDMASELKGAAEHLSQQQRAPTGEEQGWQRATEAFALISRIAGPLIALPVAIAWGFAAKGNPSTDVPESKRYLDQMAAKFGVESPFTPTVTVDPKKREKAASDKAYSLEVKKQLQADQQRESRERYQGALDSVAPADRKMFEQQVNDRHKDMIRDFQDIKYARANLIGQIAGSTPGAKAAFTRSLQQAQDPDQVKHFDDLVQIVEDDPGQYGVLLGLYSSGTWDAGSREHALLGALRKPENSFAPPRRYEVAEDMADLMSAQDITPSDPEGDDFPFDMSEFAGEEEGGGAGWEPEEQFSKRGRANKYARRNLSPDQMFTADCRAGRIPDLRKRRRKTVGDFIAEIDASLPKAKTTP